MKFSNSKVIRRFLVVFLICQMGNYALAAGDDSILSQKIKGLSYDILESFKPLLDKKHKLKIAIAELENTSKAAEESNIGSIVSDLLTTNMVRSKFFDILMRA